MLNVQRIEDINDGCAFLTYMGDMYEVAGHENGKFVYENIRTDERIYVSYEELLSGPYGIQY